MATDFRFGGVDVRPGERAIARVPVTTRLDGSELAIPVHVVRGSKPGPSLTVVSALHGSEWFSIEIVRRVVATVPQEQLAGAVIGIPVANPIALEHFTRMTPDESDEPDLNRVWPGGTTWVTEQIAAALSRDVLSRTDALIDIHTGPWGATLGAVGYGLDLPDRDVMKRSLELAVAFGYPAIRGLRVMGQFPGPRSIGGYAGAALGIPSIGPNLGGAGFAPEVEESWLDSNVRGIFNVLRQLRMLPGEPVLPARFFHFETRGHRLVPRRAGMLMPKLGPDALVTAVREGTLLAEVVSPFTFEVLESIVAPADGVIFGVARNYPVRPGDWAFFLAESDSPSSRWIDAAGTVADIADTTLHALTQRPAS
ncbi:MAG: succinylglutamate desuccinylase/aspartoacylase family protein [Thermoleophilaceae bacterium]